MMYRLRAVLRRRVQSAHDQDPDQTHEENILTGRSVQCCPAALFLVSGTLSRLPEELPTVSGMVGEVENKFCLAIGGLLITLP